MSTYLIAGGAGFIGSYFVDALLADVTVEAVKIYDNFSSGREWHYESHLDNTRLTVVRGEIADLDNLSQAMEGVSHVIHLASNPDIAAAVTDPDIDFREGTALTRCVVEAMRRTGTKTILYASGSGVYGDRGEEDLVEQAANMIPISTYGASKLAGEALIASYCFMFGMRAACFRFGNVVGSRQTHGVGYDFVRRLIKDSSQLEILGDGKQSKSYIHVEDVVRAVLMASEKQESYFEAYNIATDDYITVTEIAQLACVVLGLSLDDVKFTYTGGDRGWAGDVPVVRLNTDKIKSLGWTCEKTTRQAMIDSMVLLYENETKGLL